MTKAPLSKRQSTRKRVVRVEKTSKLGTGTRFKALTAAAKASGAKNPKAVAAAIGRKKYGKREMTQLARAGRKRKY